LDAVEDDIDHVEHPANRVGLLHDRVEILYAFIEASTNVVGNICDHVVRPIDSVGG
jgi:hypothetical protein